MEAAGKAFVTETGKELRRNREVNGKKLIEEILGRTGKEQR